MHLPHEPWHVTWERLLAEANPSPTRQHGQEFLLLAKTLTRADQQSNLARVRWGRRKHRRR